MLIPQAANAFFCLSMLSGGNGHGRPIGHVGSYPRPSHRLPPIVPYQPLNSRRTSSPYPAPPALSWRPINYHTRSF
jgi:hypothetical protein